MSQAKELVVWVGFSDGVPHHDKGAERDRQSGFTVCKTRAACRLMYQDVRKMTLVAAPKRKRS